MSWMIGFVLGVEVLTSSLEDIAIEDVSLKK